MISFLLGLLVGGLIGLFVSAMCATSKKTH